MVRKLKFHEKKLLKKVDFITWKSDPHFEVQMMRKYCVNKREDYQLYVKLARDIRNLASLIKELDPKDPFRTESSAQLLIKLYSLGLIRQKSDLMLCGKVRAPSFCSRRLPVIMTKLKMAERVEVANQLVLQGHVKVGSELVKDPAFIVSRGMEDFVTWVDSSKIRKHIMKYNDTYDDFDLAA